MIDIYPTDIIEQSYNYVEASNSVQTGFEEVGEAIEEDKASLVLIAYDSQPPEKTLHLPWIVSKNNVPYVIVESGSRLAEFDHDRSQIAATSIETNPDGVEFTEFIKNVRSLNQEDDIRKPDDFDYDAA